MQPSSAHECTVSTVFSLSATAIAAVIHTRFLPPSPFFDMLQVRVVSSSASRIPCGPSYLADIIQDGGQGEHFIIEAASGAYLLVLTRTDAAGHSPWSTDDALRFCTDAIQQSTSSAVCLFEDESSAPKSEEAFCPSSSSSSSSLVSLLSISDRAAASVGSWPAGLSTKKQQTWTIKLRQYRKKLLWLVLALVLVAAVATIAALHRSSPAYWQRYDTRGSVGPQYQLQFDHHNVSAWAARYPSPNDAWFLRIDDQAMVPPELVDADELRYQRWFRARYPEADAVRLRGDYLQEGFLGDPSAIQVPADRAFHMAHCVLAVRRYWLARESGRHVCPRDIDYKHMKHCIDALDMWAFPEGPRRSLPPTMGGGAHGATADEAGMAVDESDDTRLVWRTKVCFD